jgi:hypothetical protein
MGFGYRAFEYVSHAWNAFEAIAFGPELFSNGRDVGVNVVVTDENVGVRNSSEQIGPTKNFAFLRGQEIEKFELERS